MLLPITIFLPHLHLSLHRCYYSIGNFGFILRILNVLKYNNTDDYDDNSNNNDNHNDDIIVLGVKNFL